MRFFGKIFYLNLILLTFLLTFKLSAEDSSEASALNIGGTFTLDQIYPFFDVGTATHGAYLSRAELDLSYNFTDSIFFMLMVDLTETGLGKIGPAFLSINDILPNTNLRVGQVAVPSALETSEYSGTFTFPFFQKSLGASAFSLSLGPGFYVTHYEDNWSVQFSLKQPKISTSYNLADPWGGALRFNVVPVSNDDFILPIGASFSHQTVNSNGYGIFLSAAEADGRNLRSLARAGLDLKNANVIDFDFSPQYKSWQLNSDFFVTQANLNNADSSGNKKYYFYGASASIIWLMTGQSYIYDTENGMYNSFSDNGGQAVSLAVRYSYLDLSIPNDKAKEHNITGSVSWHPIDSIRVGAEYVHAMYKEQAGDSKLGSFIMRVQASF